MFTTEQEFKLQMSVSHARECPDFMALPRVRERRTKYGDITSCKHCKTTLWTADEIRKATAPKGGAR